MEVGKEAQTLAAALAHSAFNVANAMGAWLGGVSIAAGYGWASTGVLGAGLGVAGIAVFAVSLALDRAARKADAKGRLPVAAAPAVRFGA